MSWMIVLMAGLLEGVWAIGLKYSLGFTRFWPSLITISAMFGSLWLLSLAMKSLPVYSTYAVWAGIGISSAAVFGMAFLKEPTTSAQIVCICLVMAGILGLKLLSPNS